MNMDRSDHPKNIAARFTNIEAVREYRRIEGTETISVDELPVFIRLGRAALNTFVIVNPAVDLTETERSDESHFLNSAIETFIIDPKIYSLANRKGYKALRNGETVLFGRSNQEELLRFSELSTIVSRQHATISKSSDGETVTIKDLASSNGTYVATSPIVREAITEEWVPSTDKTPNKELMLFDAKGFSVASERHPATNEDKFIVDKKNNMYAVFDGVGGRGGGEIASEAAKKYITQRAGDITTGEDLSAVDRYLRQLLTGANDRILMLSSEAATTAALVKVHEINSELHASIAHVGDSRAYLLRDGILETLTTDHTPFRYRMGTGEAALQQERLADTDSLDILSEDDIIAFQRRNIIGAKLGGDNEVRADVNHFKVKRGDLIILTTDGIHDNLTTQEMQRLLTTAKNTDYAELLTHAARVRSRQSHLRAKKDDMTAIVVNV
ncbi:Serine/threonine phosphatase stp [compost metagenome]